MSTMQRMTMIGLYNYDNTLFDLLSLPEGYNKETFIDSFLLEHGEKCVIYTDPDFMKFSIGAVSRKWNLELQRIYEALIAEYNPIYNYDRYEEIEDHRGKKFDEKVTADYTNSRTANLQDKRTANLEDKRTANLQDKLTRNTTDTDAQTVDGNVEHKVSAFNSSSYEPSDKTTSNDGTHKLDHTGTDTTNTTGTDTYGHTGTDTYNRTGTDKFNTKGTLEDRGGGETENTSHEAHIYGNIGVVTATKMTSEIIEQRMNENLYSLAGRIFANELLIQLY